MSRPRTVEEAAALWGCSVDAASVVWKPPRAREGRVPTAALLDAQQKIAELERALRQAGADRAALLARLRRPAFRGGQRVRELRQDLRLVRLMLARKQAPAGLKLNRLVGGRAQLQERLAELPSVGNPYASIPGKGRV